MIWILFFYCVFKAKYFQNGSILDAKKKIFGVLCMEKYFEGEEGYFFGCKAEGG